MDRRYHIYRLGANGQMRPDDDESLGYLVADDADYGCRAADAATEMYGDDIYVVPVGSA